MPIITKTCITSGKTFTVSEAEQKYCTERNIPLPQQHPFERLKHIANFRNRIHLYNTTCAKTQKPILSCFPPEKNYTVYDIEAWSGDRWEATDYGQSYDSSRSFWDQYEELLKKVPLPNLNVVSGTMENSNYVNGAMNLKNCYLCFSTLDSVDCMFCWATFNSQNIVNSINCYFSEIAYECRDIEKCYNCFYIESCQNCSDSYFLLGCQSCKHCYGCVNLNNREYCWYNEQLSKDEYEKRLASVNLGSIQVVGAERSTFKEFSKQFPTKYYRGKSIEKSDGNYISNCKDTHNAFFCTDCVDVENSLVLLKSKDCFGVVSSKACELTYNSQSGMNYNCQYCNESLVGNRNLAWCMFTNGSTDCFGCVSLKKKQYCILNKQYSPEEYFKLVAQIKQAMIDREEYEDFFPRRLSPFYYNESDSMIYFPATKEDATKNGFSWKDENAATSENHYIPPDDISAVTDDILQQTLVCVKTGKKYRLTKQELDFYRRFKIPVPRIAPLERVNNFANQMFDIRELTIIACSQCQKSLTSVYNPAQQQVLCEECYLQSTF